MSDRIVARMKTDTFLKARPEQSSLLRESPAPFQLKPVKAGTELELSDYHTEDNHVWLQLAALDSASPMRWWVYASAVEIDGNEPGNAPEPRKERSQVASAVSVVMLPPLSQKMVKMPGIANPVVVSQPVYAGSKFTWAELTKDGTRIPVDAKITYNLVKLARYLDALRSYLGDRPVVVESGYRDPVSNRRVGGARFSSHLTGLAVDFSIPGEKVVDTFYKVKKFHKTGGLAVGNGFVHVDLRDGVFRWTYPNGPKVNLW